MSGGQQQRLCIARAIAVDPEVILMDEPCSALDPIATAKIEELIHELRGRYAIVIVTHNMQQAARVSQRTAFFHLGELVEYGETSDIFTNPKVDAHQGLHHRPLRLRRIATWRQPDTRVKAFDEDLNQLRAMHRRDGRPRRGGDPRSDAGAGPSATARPRAQVVEGDKRIDALEAEVERLAVQIIALRAPMADDLREVVAALKIAGVVERIGDYAKNIAKRVPAIEDSPNRAALAAPGNGADRRARWSTTCSTPSPRAIAAKAAEVCERDKAVDDFYNSIFRALLTFMMENPHNITPATHLLFVAKNLERIGDHATNVAEMVYFAATGEHLAERAEGRGHDSVRRSGEQGPDPARRGRPGARRAARSAISSRGGYEVDSTGRRRGGAAAGRGNRRPTSSCSTG